MAGALFGKTAEAALTGIFTGTPRVFLVDTGTWTPNMATEDFFDDASGVVGDLGGTGRTDGAEITNPTYTLGVFNGDDTVIQNVPAGTYEGILIINDDASADATSALVMYTDDAASGLPITTDGRDVLITWDNGAAKILKL
jgi:hypothetical protein